MGRRAGVFLRGFEPYVTMTPQTAADLGLTPRYVGVMVQPVRPVGLAGLAGSNQWINTVGDITTVVMVAANARADALGFVTQQAGLPLAEFVLAGLTALAVVAIAVSVALGQVEAAADTRTMRQVGATPGQLRGYGLARSGVILATGVPAGAVVGTLGALAVVGALRRAEVFGPFADLRTLPVAWVVSVAVVVVLSVVVGQVVSSLPVDDRRGY